LGGAGALGVIEVEFRGQDSANLGYPFFYRFSISIHSFFPFYTDKFVMILKYLIILIMPLFLSVNLSFAVTTPIEQGVNCNQEPLASDPIANNKGVAAIAQAQPALVKSGAQEPEDDDGFANYLNIYCMTYERLEGAFEFHEKLIDPMKFVSSDTKKYDAEKFWYVAGCNPQHIGGTLSPIIHLTAESPTYRLAYLNALF
jgi:hypothetical protein